ncbi:hypothetical protein PENTCL1PPCAC_10766, partial [Pristionchus entomophagus]
VPSRGALSIDAFSDPRLWRSHSLLWCVPPPSLLCQTLAWMRRARARGVLGLPYWTSHPVFPTLFPPNHTPSFVKDFIMYPEGNSILIPSTLQQGKKGTLVRDLSSTVSRVEPTLLPILLHSISGAKAASTIRAYKGSMANLRDYAMERGLDPSCPTSLVIYSLKKIQEGRALSTLKILSAAFSHYSDLPSPILAHILSHLHDSTRRKFSVSHHPSIPRSNIDSFVQYASLHPCDLLSTRTALGASLSFSALLRVSELLSLRWADLQWSSDFLKISVRRAKNDQFAEGRDTFISIEKDSLTLSLFHSYRERVVPSPWLFPSHSHPDRPLTSDTFRKDLTLLCSLAGVARITPHQLRAGGAMESISHGVPIEAVQRRGRWNSIGGIAP